MTVNRSAEPRIFPVPELPATIDTSGLFEGLFTGQEDLNILRTMAVNPSLLEAFFPLLQQVAADVLPARDREVVILRTAWRTRTPYMWAHHHAGGLAAGMSEQEIATVADQPAPPQWRPFDAVLVRAVDELHDVAHLSEATYQALARQYDQKQILELLALTGTYTLLSFILNTARVQIDPWLTDPAALPNLRSVKEPS
ncbi:carboxymuconolactone decarboxylase family protein [Nonomuraea sp. NBC_00507]|uniref:carboxymuconolactone decarboxylase family protein n=1 Tax=Nonomuraea sp. NBC_00507 TaxID=2976002 RepID=UPI002E17C24B